MSNNHHDAVMRWLREQGATEVRLTWGRRSKHPRIEFHWRGEDFRISVSGSPGKEWCAERTVKAELRHILGLIGGEKTIGSRRPRKSKPPKEQRAQLTPQRQGSDYTKFAPRGGVAKLADYWPEMRA